MKAFAALFDEIDSTTRTGEKVTAMAQYFASADPPDAAWAVHFLAGGRPKRLIPVRKLAGWAMEASDVPGWLFEECYHAVGDLAETISLLLPAARTTTDLPLHYWVEERLLGMAGQAEDVQREMVLSAWSELDGAERFVWNKLITGGFRVGVSRSLVVRAISQASGVDEASTAHRLMGSWEPTRESYERLLSPLTQDAEASRPYPFFLAYALEDPLETLGDPADWQIEWKWDGIRAQVIRRSGRTFIWSRGEELVTERFPEVADAAALLPDGTVLDGELLGWTGEGPLPFAEMQRRIGRKVLGPKILKDVPVALIAYDLLELGGEDLRDRPLAERRAQLQTFIPAQHSVIPPQNSVIPADAGTQRLSTAVIPANAEALRCREASSTTQRLSLSDARPRSALLISPIVDAASWEDVARARAEARDIGSEGLMLKRKDSAYGVGRRRGPWWKWKVDPFSVDAVMMYAQPGHGRRASLYTDYTFGVWQGDELVPFAKAYSGLTDEEIRRLDSWIRRHTVEKFGPVRQVEPLQVFEIAFEGIRLSSRHKSGLAVRFPRIARWRTDKEAREADSIDLLRRLAEST